jgi:hypothetical protein
MEQKITNITAGVITLRKKRWAGCIASKQVKEHDAY